MANHTDTTFFTNEPGSTLLDRFKRTLEDTQYFDVLVGYFRASGFYQLYESIEKVEKARILVGLGIDEESYSLISEYSSQTTMDFASHANAKKEFQQNLAKEVEKSSEADPKIEIGVKKFIEFLQQDCTNRELDIQSRGNGKKLEIRAFPSKDIHAKVYISRYHEDDKEYGSVITGSSNFSKSGLVANREFNVQLKDRRDVDFALDQFENLWKDSVDISEEFVDTIENKTWLSDGITPYELYLKLIYEYMQEDINLEENFESFLPDGFMRLEYQEQAVRQALKRLNEYNGVFLADVVGLGKTFITAQLLQQVRGNILVICPPVLQDYWEQSLIDFRVPAKVESLGKLEKIIKKGLEKWDYIVVDEAHRFRNESTQGFADLMDICRGKKVILVTATPLNNTINDIFSQLKLFQAPKNSAIPGVPNLEKFFRRLNKELEKYDKKDPEYREALMLVSKEIKEKVLKYVMVRRTRKDVRTHFKKDMDQQGLVFPDMEDPQKIVYEYEGEIETVFNYTIDLLRRFKYTRYVPLLYYEGSRRLTEFDRQQQRNVGGFMKGILVKRLESSFYAFKQSVSRFITSYERFIDMYNDGTIYISKKVKVYDLLDNDDIEKLEKAVEEERAQKYDSKDFNDKFLEDLKHDLEVLKEMKDWWKNVTEDPKLEKFIQELKKNATLKKKKLVIFTESKETGDYLYENLLDEFPDQVMFYSSKGGRHSDKELTSSKNIARDMITNNYDPNSRAQEDSLRILIATDVLAEGINLHRSNILINYDLPWNPTRVLQRVGRVNRLGTKHPRVWIYNFFPTTQSDEHLGLETNITNKIQLFHNVLGEDAKYLSDGEEVDSQELFETLNKKSLYTDEDEEGDTELQYLQMMREIRDDNPDLFERIKKLPKKARSGRKIKNNEENKLVTFFRLGRLKKFYLTNGKTASELDFFGAIHFLECKPEVKRAKIDSRHYFQMLSVNKAKFELDTTEDESDKSRGGASNVKYVEKRMKDPMFRNFKGFTDSDDEFISAVKTLIKDGLIAKKTAQKIRKEFEVEDNPIKMLGILKQSIRSTAINAARSENSSVAQREVVLSGYLV